MAHHHLHNPMHAITFLQDLAVVMIVAGLVTVLFHRFKQPVVLGYIIAGVIIGPHTPPYSLIHDEETINILSELGIILLMFSLGLEFSLRKLTRVGVPALIAALLEIVLLFWVGYEIGHLFGWPLLDSVFLGAMLSMSSTTVIIKVLGELGKMKERFAQLIFGILIIEDILGIAMIALLSGIAMTGKLSVVDVGVTLGRLGIFLAVTLVVGLIAVPRLLTYVARFKNSEMLLVSVLGLCFGFSLLAVKLGYSVALGAFLIGAVIAESREIHRIEALVEPVRDMFSAVFFVAIGLLIDPKMLLTYWQPVAVITLAVIAGKILTCSFGAFIGGNDTRNSLRVGMGLAQIGEFSFIIASLGQTLNVTSKFLYPVAVAVSSITTLLTPFLIKSADGLADSFHRTAPRSLVNVLSLYTDWVGQLGRRRSSMATRLIRRWAMQMALNIMLIAAVFIAAAFAIQHPPIWLTPSDLSGEWLKAVLWLTAVILSLPMVIATLKKLQALGLLVAEMKVTEASAGERTVAIRSIVAQIIPIIGTVILGGYIIILSSTFLPNFKVFIVLLAIAALVSWFLRRSFIKVYSKAQVALQETFSQTPPPKTETIRETLPTVFRDAALETVTIPAGSSGVGKRIRELQLRSLTGASIVGIERGGQSLINPDPDEELHVQDRLLLVGTRPQLNAAKVLLEQ
jgi:CPA2 family monovalent cation:H+ antiporter-2